MPPRYREAGYRAPPNHRATAFGRAHPHLQRLLILSYQSSPLLLLAAIASAAGVWPSLRWQRKWIYRAAVWSFFSRWVFLGCAVTWSWNEWGRDQDGEWEGGGDGDRGGVGGDGNRGGVGNEDEAQRAERLEEEMRDQWEALVGGDEEENRGEFVRGVRVAEQSAEREEAGRARRLASQQRTLGNRREGLRIDREDLERAEQRVQERLEAHIREHGELGDPYELADQACQGETNDHGGQPDQTYEEDQGDQSTENHHEDKNDQGNHEEQKDPSNPSDHNDQSVQNEQNEQVNHGLPKNPVNQNRQSG